MFASTHTDRDGNVVAVYDDGDLGVYKHEGNEEEAKAEVEENYSEDNTSAGGEDMGTTVHSLSFADFEDYEENGANKDGSVKVGDGAKIDFKSTWAGDMIEKSLSGLNSFAQYATEATGRGDYNLKYKSEGGIYSGSQVKPGVYGSARD
ncbi:hypothetical protein, partial [Salinivirga cyanobacteriivorans]